ncbi:MAG: sulfatase [Chloroflexi bacterium]|nr:MAG: sulfatase [Chloroflexota bacterium]
MTTPNIIYLHSHDTGRYVQPYGYAVPTPNIQRLAEEGVLFRQAFCAAPTCSASRAALLTGQSPHNAGMTGLVNRGWQLRDYRQHLLHTLRDAGYHTVLAGTQHLHRDRTQIGFDQIIAPSDSGHVKDVIPVAHAFLRNAPKQPFFLDVGFFETHREFPKADPAAARYVRPPAPLPDTPATRQDMADFTKMVRELDDGVGLLLDALDATGLAENTLVIQTTDHGLAFPAMKCNLTDHGLGVLLILRGPGGFRGGKVVDALVSHLDLFPTLCDLLNIAPPSWLQGKSIMPLIRGEQAEINEEIFAEVTYHAAYEPQRAVRTRRYKYIRRFAKRTEPVLPNCDDSLSKEVWLAHGWATRQLAHEQLYDLIFDPNEAHNLADDPAYRSIIDEMRGRLERWMKETDDPLLQGIPPRPPGAQLNDPAGLSPQEPLLPPGRVERWR